MARSLTTRRLYGYAREARRRFLRVENSDAAGVQLRARAAGLLFLAGGTIGLVSVLLPHYAGADDAGLWTNIVLAYLGALGCSHWGRTADPG